MSTWSTGLGWNDRGVRMTQRIWAGRWRWSTACLWFGHLGQDRLHVFFLVVGLQNLVKFQHLLGNFQDFVHVDTQLFEPIACIPLPYHTSHVHGRQCNLIRRVNEADVCSKTVVYNTPCQGKKVIVFVYIFNILHQRAVRVVQYQATCHCFQNKKFTFINLEREIEYGLGKKWNKMSV